MRVYNFIQSKEVLTSIWILCVVITRAQKRLVLREPRLNVVVVGDIGVPESMSEVKRRVMETIRKEHNILPFNLGINLGANVYRSHSQKNDFDTLQDVFTSSFPPRLFKFDFLSVLVRVDYDCDLATQLQYYQYDSRFHMPARNFYYDVELSDNTKIRFVCIDSTPIFVHGLRTKKEMLDDIDICLTWLENSEEFHYVFLVLHHNFMDGCGPHREVPHNQRFMKLITHQHLTAIINGQNRNMQMFSPVSPRPPVIVVGNSALVDPIEDSLSPPALCMSPESGGFGEMVVTKDMAYFKFVTGKGKVLGYEIMYPRQNPSAVMNF